MKLVRLVLHDEVECNECDKHFMKSQYQLFSLSRALHVIAFDCQRQSKNKHWIAGGRELLVLFSLVE